MTQAKTGDTVKVHYTGTLDDGTVFDSSLEREPLEFTLGAQQVVPGFENGVIGMAVEESKTVNIPCDQAYGPHNPQQVIEIGRDQIPADLNLQVGQQLQMSADDGQTLVVTVAELSDETVKLDANHMLAGKDLTFEIKLVSISN
jgi:peptidylprolyl isomerase